MKPRKRMGEQKATKRIVLPGHDRRPPSSRYPYIYLLSPANSAGRRARMLLNPLATFDLAQRLRTISISLGEAYSFMSALYFRGNLTYADSFSHLLPGLPGTLVITSARGLLRPETQVRLDDLLEIAGERIVPQNPKYRDPLERDLRTLSEVIGDRFRVILLGSLATRKYLPLLEQVLGERLLVPRAFIGLGNMSRGALLLRCSRERSELEYIPASQVLSKEAKS